MDRFDVLRELMELPGPTGREQLVMDWLRERWTGRVDRLWETPIGNLLAHVGGQGPKLLLQAHADEIGFVVRSIDSEGFLWLTSGQRSAPDVGKRYPVGQPALVLGRNGPIDGLFAAASGHVLSEAQRQKHRIEYSDLFVDIGASSRDEATSWGIHVGAGVIWNPPVRRLGPRIYGKAVDDRVALALMTYLLDEVDRDALSYDVYYAVTVQEENGLIGASSLRAEVDADFAIAFEVGIVGDIPTVGDRVAPPTLGSGPLLVHKDDSAHYNYDLTWRLAEVAERAGVPVQHAVFERFGSDGASLIRQGIPTALLGVGTRYTHSPFEMVDERDVDATLRLLTALVTTPVE